METNPKLMSNIEFDGNYYVLKNNNYCPLFLQQINFKDEYEANFVYALWINYSKSLKDKIINQNIIDNFNNLLDNINLNININDDTNEITNKNFDILRNIPNSFNIVFGSEINENLSNIKVIESLIIPNINDIIFYDKKHYLVINKMINYQQILNYELNQNGRGREMIYIFVKHNF